MADNLRKVPKKGILKSSSSFEKPESFKCNQKEMKWDEINILQTLHPPDKDYGHMKIDEPKTPYTHYKDPEDGDQQKGSADPHSDDEQPDGIDADLLAKKIQVGLNKLPKAMVSDDEDEDDEDEEYLNETEEERAKRKLFEQKRKLHYNEFYAIKLARKLMEEEGDNEDDDEEDNEEDCDDDDEDDNENIGNRDSFITDEQENGKTENPSLSSTCKSATPVSKDVGDSEGN